MKNTSRINFNTNVINFSDLLGQFQSGIGLVDEGNQWVYVNPGLMSLLGYLEEEMIHQPLSAFIQPNQHRFLLMKLQSANDDENVFTLINLIRKDGQQVMSLLSYTKFHLMNCGFRGAAILVLDLHKEQDLSALINQGQLLKAREYSNLNRIITEIARTQDLETLLNLVFSSIRTATGFDGGGFFAFRNEDPTLFTFPAGKFIKLPSEMVDNLRFVREQRPDLLTGVLFVLSDVNPTPDHIKVHKAFFNLLHPENYDDLNAVMIFNLQDKKRTNGIFGFYHQSENAFTPIMVEITDTLTSFAAIAIENMYLVKDKETIATQQERLRLSRELHDSVAQELYSLILYGEASRRALSAHKIAVVEENLEEIIHLSRNAMRDLRLLIFELRPPLVEEVGLLGAIIARLEAVEKRSGIHTEFNVFGESKLSSEVEDELYRIVLEALNNVLKHSKAKNVYVDIHFFNNKTLILVKDDGVGFKANQPGPASGVGLKSIAERVARLGGKLKIESEKGQGTIINIFIDNP